MKYSQISPVLRKFLLQKNIGEGCEIVLAGKAGSNREYYRVKSDVTYIVLRSPETDDDFGRFLRLTQFYRLVDFPVPKVYCIDDNLKQVLLEDLGDVRLYDITQENNSDMLTYFKLVIHTLVELQTRCYQRHMECPDIFSRVFDIEDLLWESSYYKNEYLLGYLNLPETDLRHQELQTVFEDAAQRVGAHPKSIMHRDFQSQNIMFQHQKIRIIDYQGSRLGSVYYDLASLLLDPYVMLNDANIHLLFKEYHSASLSKNFDEAYEAFLYAGFQRVMQALGAYCFLSGKKEIEIFKTYIAPGKQRLQWIMNELNFSKDKQCLILGSE